MVQNAAKIVRNEIMEQGPTIFPNNCNAESLKGAASTIPPLTQVFFETLVGGEPGSDRNNRLSKSLASDAVFTASGGVQRPLKHINLGLAISSLTGITLLQKICNNFKFFLPI